MTGDRNWSPFTYSLKGNKTTKILWLKSICIEERIMGKIVKNFKKVALPH